MILVPGILESSLAIEKDPEFFGIWPLTPSWVPLADFLGDLLSDLGTNIRKQSMDEKVSVVTTGLLPGAYDGIISAIIKWGYKIGNNFWTFPYDWRQSNDISGQMLAEFIKNKNLDSVDIICHSMGGFVTRAAYNHGVRAHIKRTAYIASPHFGNPLSYFELNPEIHNVGFYDFYEKGSMTDQVRYIITRFEEKINNLYRKWPSAYELMPDDIYLNERAMIHSDGQPIHGTKETYLENEWSLPQNEQDKVRKAMEFKKSLGEKLPGNDDDILVIYSNTLETLDTIGYSSIGITIDANYPTYHFSPPIDYNQCGDTVVVTNSAMGSMSGSPTYKNSKSIPNVTHTGLPNNDETIEKIKKFLKV